MKDDDFRAGSVMYNVSCSAANSNSKSYPVVAHTSVGAGTLKPNIRFVPKVSACDGSLCSPLLDTSIVSFMSYTV